MAGGGRKKREIAVLGGKDDRLALALARGMTRAEAAKHAELGERTVYTKLQDPAFRALVARRQEDLIGEVVSKLAGSGSDAVGKLVELLKDPESIIQLRAAKTLLDELVKVGVYQVLDARLKTLESQVKEPQRKRLIIPDRDDRWD